VRNPRDEGRKIMSEQMKPLSMVIVSGQCIGVGFKKECGIMTVYDVIANTLMDGDKNDKRSRKNAQAIIKAWNRRSTGGQNG
jgi:hypothetical protein